MKNVKEAAGEKSDDPVKSSLEKSGIAGTESEKEKESSAEDAEKKKDSKEDEKKEEPMEVSLLFIYFPLNFAAEAESIMSK